jgi:threonine dehydratase
VNELAAVAPITLEAIEAARARIAGTIVRTPLVKLQTGAPGPEIYLKLENLQPINAFKLRGAANAVALLPPERRALGVWTISAGNAGQGVAYAARQAGVPCTVVTIETAPETKVERMRALGAHLVKAPFDACWTAMERRAFPGVEGTFVHPFDDDDFIAGNATMGLEIVEDLPEVATVIAAIGGGGLLDRRGLGRARAQARRAHSGRRARDGGARGALVRQRLRFEFDAWQASFVDGAGGKSVFPRMWERMQPLLDGSIVVTLDETKRAMRLLAEKSRVIAEGAGALAVAAALGGKAGAGPIVAIVSGGNIELSKFCELIGSV